MERRRKSAIKLINKLKESHSIFVNQADTISKELHHVAILTEEAWIEKSAAAFEYFGEEKYDLMANIMLELHKSSEGPPKSQNDAQFYEKFGGAIYEARTYLDLYLKYKDHLALCQAFEIYLVITREMEDRLGGLETVDHGTNSRCI